MGAWVTWKYAERDSIPKTFRHFISHLRLCYTFCILQISNVCIPYTEGKMEKGWQVDKSRRQLAIWVTTDDMLRKLSEHLGRSKVEVVHLAVVEMTKRCFPEHENG